MNGQIGVYINCIWTAISIDKAVYSTYPINGGKGAIPHFIFLAGFKGSIVVPSISTVVPHNKMLMTVVPLQLRSYIRIWSPVLRSLEIRSDVTNFIINPALHPVSVGFCFLYYDSVKADSFVLNLVQWYCYGCVWPFQNTWCLGFNGVCNKYDSNLEKTYPWTIGRNKLKPSSTRGP